MTERTLLNKLKRIYGKQTVKPDLFGKRDALPSEVQRVLKVGFPESLDVYLPTEEDILIKDGER